MPAVASTCTEYFSLEMHVIRRLELREELLRGLTSMLKSPSQ